MTPIKLIARQLADLEPYCSDMNARAELLDAAEAHDKLMNQMANELHELRRVVHRHLVIAPHE